MSVKIMAMVFESETLGPTERLILLALADHANDEGHCYPSIARLCQRTGLGERAVQGNLSKLEAAGYLEIERGGGRGNKNLYTVIPSPKPVINPARETPYEMHPARETPFLTTETPHLTTENPAPDAPEPSKNHQEPPREDVRAILEEVATPAAVTSFIAYRRKRKGGALTVTAAKRLAGNLRAILDGGGDPSDALGMAEERGWQSVQADWYFNAKSGPAGGARPVGIVAARSRRIEDENRIIQATLERRGLS